MTRATTARSGEAAGTAARGSLTADKLRAYAKLAKLSFYDYYLSALVVWTVLATTTKFDGRTFATLVLVTLAWVGIVAATVTFDDVTGFRDGSDQRNYDPAQGGLRNRSRKPLLDGLLTAEEAMRFGWLAVGWAALFLVLTAVVAPHRPGWVLGLMAFVLIASIQYSYGLRLSYRGGQELVLLLSTGLTVLIPFGLITGEATGLVLVETYLFGLWSLLVSVYSNINDLAGDRAAGRTNVATRTSTGGYRGFVLLLSGTEALVVLGAAAAGIVPRWFPLVLAPVLALRAYQLSQGLVAGSPLAARKLGIQIHRLGVVLLLAANLLITS